MLIADPNRPDAQKLGSPLQGCSIYGQRVCRRSPQGASAGQALILKVYIYQRLNLFAGLF